MEPKEREFARLRFFSYSSQYEYKVSQDCFTYYINKEYRDLILTLT